MLSNNNSIPANIEMEKRVLGAMMIRGGEKIPEITSILSADDFYRPEHKVIFNHIINLYESGIDPNLISLLENLKESKDLKALDLNYVANIGYWHYTTAFAVSDAKKIKEKSALRNLKHIFEQSLNNIQNNLSDPSDVLNDTSDKLAKLNIANDDSTFSSFGSFFKQDFDSEIEQSKKYNCRKTGFDNIDAEQIFGAGLYVLGATPAAGKTTFAWQMAEQISKLGETCIFCSYEMGRLELFTKSVARELFNRNPQTALTAAQIRRGGTSNTLSDVISDLSNSSSDLRVLELRDETVDDLLKILRPVCTNTEKSPIVFIDYLQIIPSDKDTAKNKIDDTVRKLKIFQRESNTTFIIISSLNRQNYTQQISFESFKESGGIEYTADVIWGLQLNVLNNFKTLADVSKIRKEIDDAKKNQPRDIQLKCLKNRQGNNYDCYFHYFSAHDFFEPCALSDFEKKL